MRAVKYSFNDTNTIDLVTKVIYKYPSPTKIMDIGLMVVNGRNPQNKKSYLIEHESQFIMYIIKGQGIVYAGEQVLSVKPKDVIFIPSNTPFAVEGSFEYITLDHPAFQMQQSEEISAA